MNGKGDSPKNCFSQQYRDNFDRIFRRKPKLPSDDEIRRRVILPDGKRRNRRT
jgi:hypothetical protein